MASSLENEKRVKNLARSHLSPSAPPRRHALSDKVEEFASVAPREESPKTHPDKDHLHQEVIKNRLDGIVGSDRTKPVEQTESSPTSIYEYIDVSFVPSTRRSINIDHFENAESEGSVGSPPDVLFISGDDNGIAASQTANEEPRHAPNAPVVNTDELRHDFDFKSQDSNLKSPFKSQYELVLVEILSLLKIPFCQSPHEAESQCAFLNESNLVDYVISDDSDTFLFGDVKVIRNFYKRNRMPQLYSSNTIEEHLSLSRIQLIIFAMLVGCDYTSGIKGIGAVKALSIVQGLGCNDDDAINVYDQFCNLCNRLNIDLIPKKEICMSFAEPVLNRDQRQFKWEDEYDFSELKSYLQKKIGMDPEILKSL